MGTLPHLENAFRSVGWFIPPYAPLGFLSKIGGDIVKSSGAFTPDDLELALAPHYSINNLAAMVTSHYARAPVIAEYKESISEAIEAHLLGLTHVSVAGLVPVIEGAGRELLKTRNSRRSSKAKHVERVFVELAEDCKQQSRQGNAGNFGEVESMLDSFAAFTTSVLYVGSQSNPFLDNTNRHGISHGLYRDRDYGRLLNFFKIIGAVDFLTFVSSFNASLSWMGPTFSPESHRLALYYQKLQAIHAMRAP